MIHPKDRRWVRVIGTDKVFQMTVAFIKRLGKDMVEVSYTQAMALRDRQDRNNKLKAQQNQLENVEAALLAANRPGGPLPKGIPTAPAAPEPTPAAPETEPETAEEALARVTAEGGDDDELR